MSIFQKMKGWETPPRAWGRRVKSRVYVVVGGNTPTCVGKTGLKLLRVPARWKHPHVRGEDQRTFYRHRFLILKHPHVRGEDFLPNVPHGVGVETPPRAWGRQRGEGCPSLNWRNTPTCVGKTLRDYSLFLLSRQNNIETSSFSDTSCSPDNSMSWRFGSPMP